MDKLQNTRQRPPSLRGLLRRLHDIRAHTQEHFVCITLDSRHYVIAKHIVFIGTLNSTLAHPREIFKCALTDSAAAIVVAHNHPSGIVEPSDADIETTQQLAAAGQLLGIPLLDHIIVSKDDHFSFAASGYMTYAKIDTLKAFTNRVVDS
jgi:DNA repair protein RadC